LELYPCSTHHRRSPSDKVLVDTIRCRRCQKDSARLEKAPFRNPIGERVHQEICRACWSDWLQHQTLLINHYGLDPRDPKARDFLYAQIESVLLKGEDGEQVDTSMKGSIEF
jgi:Fe-S cluster biosynthesis and repair protein YggX